MKATFLLLELGTNSIEYSIGGFISILILVYLIYYLIKPEKF